MKKFFSILASIFFCAAILLGTPIAIHSPTELEPFSSDLADSFESSSSSEPEHPTTPADAATPQDDITWHLENNVQIFFGLITNNL